MIDHLANRSPADEPTVSTWVRMPGSFNAEVIGRAGISLPIPEMQHGSISWADIVPMLQSFELAGAQCLVRSRSQGPSKIGRALGYGTTAVVIPLVATAE